jgi:hypothetical protein
MPRSDPEGEITRPGCVRRGPVRGDFVLYVEGPCDRDILRVWARCLSPLLARALESSAVVLLGGRQPARALEHFRRLGGATAGVRGLVVLDRDHHSSEPDAAAVGEPGLELFTWRRRHIESYVLVPSAMRRALGLASDDSRAGRLLEDHLPDPGDEDAHRQLNAKRLLGSKGPLARRLGQDLSPGGIARCMRADELHVDVIELYARIREGLGLHDPTPQVLRRL